MITIKKLDIVELTINDRVIHLSEDDLRRLRAELDRYFGPSMTDQIKRRDSILPPAWIESPAIEGAAI